MLHRKNRKQNKKEEIDTITKASRQTDSMIALSKIIFIHAYFSNFYLL